MILRILLVSLVIILSANGANILGIYFHAGQSHNLLGQALLKELARRGHNVTMASAFPLKEPIPNYTDVNLTGILEDQLAREGLFMKINQGHIFSGVSETKELVRTQTLLTLTHPEMKKLIDSGTKFDLIIIDWFLNHAILYFGKIFNAPVIPLASQGISLFVSSITGNPVVPSYVPISMFPFPPSMSFFERTANSLLAFYFFVIGEPGGINYQIKLIKEHFNDDVTWEELQQTVALILTNSHYSFETPRPVVPNVIPVGGFHIEKPQPLPKDIQRIMDNAKGGVIYFSLGSQMQSSLLPIETQQAFLRAFGRLPLTVLWKFDGDIAHKPQNVIIRKWFPQSDILAHRNLRVFITHGGLLSTVEAIHYGVPVLGVPICNDQKSNVLRMVSYGFALELELSDITEGSVSTALNKLITDRKYWRNAKKRSSLFHDQPMSPMDTAVFWVEHVMRHKGADHLRNTGIHLSWWQYLLFDVVTFIAACILTLTYVFYRICKTIYRKLVHKTKQD